MMITRYLLRLLLLWALLVGVGGNAPAFAQSSVAQSAEVQSDEAVTHKAGVVVVAEDGTVTSRCVGFPEESISGYDLLVRGSFAPRSEVTSMGASICSLNGQGCGEGEDCFCQCKSSTCRYWTYWQQLPDGWRYSNAGAATLQIHDGDVQGWVWGDSKPNASAESAPPDLTFAEICSVNAPIFGIANDPSATSSVTDASGTDLGELWWIVLVIGAPLLLGAGWWLWQRRAPAKPVQP